MAAAAAAAKQPDRQPSGQRNRPSVGSLLFPKVNSGAALRRKTNVPSDPLQPEQVESLVARLMLHVERGQFAMAVAVCLQAWDDACDLESLRQLRVEANLCEALCGDHEAVIEACLHLRLHTIADLLNCPPKKLLAEPGVSPSRLRAVGKELRNFLTGNEFDLLVRERSTEALALDSRGDSQAANDGPPI